MRNTTISSNTAADVGASLYTNGTANLTHVTIADNTSPATVPGGVGVNVFQSGASTHVTLRNSLLARNLAAGISFNCGSTGGGNLGIASNGWKLDTDGTCALNGTGDWSGSIVALLDAKLGLLADNGGPTQTQALDATSPAMNAASPVHSTVFLVDQRGVTRDSMPNIGAYEYVTGAVAMPASGGGCFIATAAYGTSMATDVRYLRAHDSLRAWVRTGLAPLVDISKTLVTPEAVKAETANKP